MSKCMHSKKGYMYIIVRVLSRVSAWLLLIHTVEVSVVALDAIVPIHIDILLVVRVKHSLDLIQSYQLGAEVVKEDDGLNQISTVFKVRAQSRLQAGKCPLKSSHAPFRALAQGNVGIVSLQD